METPVKSAETFCLLCEDKVKRLFCLTKHKAVSGKFVDWIEKCLEVTLEKSLLEFMYVCEICANMSKSYSTFKQNGIENVRKFNKMCFRKKRMTKTPPSAVRESVAEKLIQSVEKLRQLDLNDSNAPRPHKKSKVKLNFSDIHVSDDHETSANEYANTGATNCSLCSENDENIDTCYLFDHGYSTATKDKSISLSIQNDANSLQSHRKSSVFDHEYSSVTKDKVMNIPSPLAVENLFMVSEKMEISNKIGKQLTQLSKHGNSILFRNNPVELSERNWFTDILDEMKRKCPELQEVLLCAVGDKVNPESKMATIGTMYGMILNCRNKKASAIQRLYTTLAIRYHADNKLLKRLQKTHITLSDESKRHIMEQFAEFSSNNIIKEISAGKDEKNNGDNLDIYVKTNDIRMNNRNRDYHFFASDWTADRVDLTNLYNSKPLIENEELLSVKMFMLNEEEIKMYKTSIKFLMGRITTQYMPGFQWMDSVTTCTGGNNEN